MDDRQLIEDLLSALEYHTEQTRPIEFSKVAIEAAREYLRKPAQQEPVAWGVFEGNLHDMFFSPSEAQEMADLKGTHAEVRPLYTTPPQRKPLTKDEICAIGGIVAHGDVFFINIKQLNQLVGIKE